MLEGDLSPGDEALVDFVANVADVLTVDAGDVVETLASVPDLAAALIHIIGGDEAAVIAGQTLAITAGVGSLVAKDPRSARRVAVMMTQVLQAS